MLLVLNNWALFFSKHCKLTKVICQGFVEHDSTHKINSSITVMCLSIGTPKNNKFSICSKWKFIIFRCLKIWAHYSLIIMHLNIGTPKTINFSFGTNFGTAKALLVQMLSYFFSRQEMGAFLHTIHLKLMSH